MKEKVTYAPPELSEPAMTSTLPPTMVTAVGMKSHAREV